VLSYRVAYQNALGLPPRASDPGFQSPDAGPVAQQDTGFGHGCRLVKVSGVSQPGPRFRPRPVAFLRLMRARVGLDRDAHLPVAALAAPQMLP